MRRSSENYNLLYTKTAVRDIKQLDIISQKKIKKKLEQYSQNPFLYGRKLVKSSLGSYRFRMGNYRVIFDIEGKNILILRAGHRKEIYR